MVIAIHENSDIPIYLQIRDQIMMGISDGRLKPGESLPTVRALALEIGINTMTVSKAYQLLVQQGLIVTDRRNGARVRSDFQGMANHLSEESLVQLRKVACEAKLRGMSEEEFLLQCKRLYGGDAL